MKDAISENQVLKVGILQKDKNEGPMIEEWLSFFLTKSNDCEVFDVSSSLSSLVAIKDPQELVLKMVLY